MLLACATGNVGNLASLSFSKFKLQKFPHHIYEAPQEKQP